MHDRLEFARELAAIAQAGITYSPDPYDQERFERLREMAGEMLEVAGEVPKFQWPEENGYDTPKVDVRAMVFRGDEILLVKEARTGAWTVPGGWADVNLSPAENAEKECFEESGYVVKCKALVSVLDKDKAGFPRNVNSIYKMYFLCELIGGKPTTSLESTAVGFFPVNDLPELDAYRIAKRDILDAYDRMLDSGLETTFN
ncbi:NUDIX hydrolase [Luteolibacter sp. AS25]|uniref:NUDIX hydrolase n=1 Tax=Luteolibacter sp. AS25 TaxID=3135776 RepID=UPI00398A80CB